MHDSKFYAKIALLSTLNFPMNRGIVMNDITKVDKNFTVKTSIEKEDICFYPMEESPFQIYGIFKENGLYRRMPEAVAKEVNEGVYTLHTDTAGGRVRFVTDSSYVAIHVRLARIGRMPHFTLAGSAGFDLYADDVYIKTFVPPYDMEDGFESVIDFDTRQTREITVNLPLYGSVKELYIGLQKDAVVQKATSYKNKKPVVFYGSSITQGGCASRPGMSYQNIVAREFHLDYINLGFSGSARAEDAIIDYIKDLDMSMFVCDYDFNAPSVEHLRNTHEKLFLAVRKEHPDIPIILMSKPKFYLDDADEERLNIIRTTYENAKNAGDNKVYLLTGSMLTELCGNEGTVDGTHPTDFGFASMAKALSTLMKDNNICMDLV